MVTMIYPDAAADATEEEEVRIPAGGWPMLLDWDAVARAFEGANEELGWDADFEIRPERRHVSIIVPGELKDRVSSTIFEFYEAVAKRMGEEEFMSVWVDYALAPC